MATITLYAVSGTGTGNDFSATGTNVGTDCASIDGVAAYHVNDVWGTEHILMVPIEDSPGDLGTINSVTIKAYLKHVDVSGLVGFKIRHGGYNQSGTQASTDSYTWYEYTWTQIGGAPWTWNDVNNLEAGIRVGAGDMNSDLYVDCVCAVVDYTVPLPSNQTTGLLFL